MNNNEYFNNNENLQFADNAARLRFELRELHNKRKKVFMMRTAGVIFALTLIFSAFAFIIIPRFVGGMEATYDFDLLAVLLFAGGFGSFVFDAVVNPVRGVNTQIQDVVNELDLIGLAEAPREQRAEKLFKVHQFELKKYYDLTLAQSRWIFFVGVLCIVAGFVIIGFTGYGLYYVLVEKGKQIEDGLLTGATGLLSAILVEFIGKVFMDMYKKAVESLGEFHKRLVTTHHLHFANFLVAKIADEKERGKILAGMASKLAGVNVIVGETPEPTPGVG